MGDIPISIKRWIPQGSRDQGWHEYAWSLLHFFDFRIPADARAKLIAKFPEKILVNGFERALNATDAPQNDLFFFRGEAELFVKKDVFHAHEVNGYGLVQTPVTDAKARDAMKVDLFVIVAAQLVIEKQGDNIERILAVELKYLRF